MTTQSLVNIGSNNGLLPDNNKPLPEPVFIIHHLGLVAFGWGQHMYHERRLKYLYLMYRQVSNIRRTSVGN